MLLTLLFVLILLSLTVNVLLMTGQIDFKNPKAPEKPSLANRFSRRTQGRKNINLITVLVLLVLSNFVLAAAWYGHLKYDAYPMVLLILSSWVVAFLEYALLIPATRIGKAYLQVSHIKVLQLVFTTAMFAVFANLYFGLTFGLKEILGLVLIMLGAIVIFIHVKMPTCPEGRYVLRAKGEEV